MLAASALMLTTAPGGSSAPTAPSEVRGWLGNWKTNFGELWVYSVAHSDVNWYDNGQEYSTCQALKQCEYGWLLRGYWHWPGHDWVNVKGYVTGKDGDTVGPCWEGPASLEVPGTQGNYCFAMLLFRYGESKEQGGFWKVAPCRSGAPTTTTCTEKR